MESAWRGAGGPGVEPATITITRGGRVVVAVRQIPPADGRPWRSVTQAPAKPPVSRPIRVMEGHAGPIRAVAISPDGAFGHSSSGFLDGDKSIRLWDLATGREVLSFLGHTDQVVDVAFAPDGRSFVSCSWDCSAWLWDVDGGLTTRGIRTDGSIGGCAYAPDGQRIYLGLHKGRVGVYDVADGREIGSLVGHGAGVNCVAVSPDGRRLLTGGGVVYRDGPATPGSAWALRRWDVSDPTPPTADSPKPAPHASPPIER